MDLQKSNCQNIHMFLLRVAVDKEVMLKSGQNPFYSCLYKM